MPTPKTLESITIGLDEIIEKAVQRHLSDYPVQQDAAAGFKVAITEAYRQYAAEYYEQGQNTTKEIPGKGFLAKIQPRRLLNSHEQQAGVALSKIDEIHETIVEKLSAYLLPDEAQVPDKARLPNKARELAETIATSASAMVNRMGVSNELMTLPSSISPAYHAEMLVKRAGDAVGRGTS